MLLDRAASTAVVSIVGTSDLSDIGLSQRLGADMAQTADAHITRDGTGGALPRMIANRSTIVMYKHWWSLFDQGRETGLKILREVLSRLRQTHGDQVQWMKCSDIARYYAAAKTYRMTYVDEENEATVRLESPFSCPGFTVSFLAGRHVRGLAINGAPLRETPAPGRAEPGTWRRDGQTVYACFDLAEDTRLIVLS
jgi:hypothetical protein